ncbi:hypothetical protein TSUD_206470 [Trifolium subterraneum]|uniref:F-box associated beta-propeller type 1 domain-containing protein n=1 Tax=Trifolium subterraneum TaxID=3900 RepID=A0A2Z6MLS4_TRISU|nr:hypothetical protein TSUD_206470 [Trifolium subterraneum]
MRTKSKEFTVSIHDCDLSEYSLSFGYDNSTQTYKVVAFYVEDKGSRNPKTMVKVFSLGDNSWRDLQCFPLIPLYWFSDKCYHNGVHLNGTINWLAHHDYKSVDDHYVILSLDLSTETYTQLLLPLGFDNKDDWPKIVLLADRLCFCHDFEETHFVMWQMKDFGVQDSWIQLFKISYENHLESAYLLPLYLSENTLLLANERDLKTSIYSCIDNKVEKTAIRNNIGWLYAMDYVESLVPTH